jgi:protein transport protein SEC61 subunit gamma and related proteins
MLVRRCAKPDRKEFTKHIVATSMGFLVMGFIGFFVKVLSQSSLPFRL